MYKKFGILLSLFWPALVVAQPVPIPIYTPNNMLQPQVQPVIPQNEVQEEETDDFTPPPKRNIYAKEADPALFAFPPSYVEAGLQSFNVSDGFGNGFGQFIAAQIQADARNRWTGQIQHQNAFGDSGFSAALGNIHVFNPDWYSDVGVAVGSDANFLPQFRVDAAINRKWLEGRNLITTAGITYSQAQETYSDQALFLGAAYYFPTPWVIQGGVRFDVSSPGGVFAPSAFGALTYGYQGRYLITGRYGIGRQAYQLLGPQKIVNSFIGHDAGLTWRQWVGYDWGFSLGADFATNTNYTRHRWNNQLFQGILMELSPSLERMAHLRYRNSQGKIIPLHHAFLTMHLSQFSRIGAVVLAIFFLFALPGFFLPLILTVWEYIFDFWNSRIYTSGLHMQEIMLLGHHLSLPMPDLTAELPTRFAVWMNLFICIVAFIIFFIFSQKPCSVYLCCARRRSYSGECFH